MMLSGLCLFIRCTNNSNNDNPDTQDINVNKDKDQNKLANSSIADSIADVVKTPPEYSAYELALMKKGFVDVLSLDSTLKTDLRYAGDENFTNEILYDSIQHCFLLKEVGEMLVEAHQTLKSKDSTVRFLLLDCLRPNHVQHKMWDLVRGTDEQKYVASPHKGSMHNYGTAVDLTLVDLDGKELDLGSAFDDFSNLAQPRHELGLLKDGKISLEALDRRWMLKTSMKAAGFRTIQTEWWHYNAFHKDVVRSRYEMIK